MLNVDRKTTLVVFRTDYNGPALRPSTNTTKYTYVRYIKDDDDPAHPENYEYAEEVLVDTHFIVFRVRSGERIRLNARLFTASNYWFMSLGTSGVKAYITRTPPPPSAATTEVHVESVCAVGDVMTVFVELVEPPEAEEIENIKRLNEKAQSEAEEEYSKYDNAIIEE